MALVHVDSFGTFPIADLGLLYANNGGSSLTTGPYLSGPNPALAVPSGNWIQRGIAAIPDFAVGIRLKAPDLGQSPSPFSLSNADGPIAIVSVTNGGAIEVSRRFGTIISATPAGGAITADTWNYYELVGHVGGAGSGWCVLYCNGASLGRYDGDLTGQMGGAASVSIVRSAGRSVVTDFYIDSAAVPRGLLRVCPVALGALGTYAEWDTLVGAADEQAAITTEDGDTSYVASGTAGQRVSIAHAALPSVNGSVVAVAVKPCMRKDDAGARSAAAYIVTAAGEAVGPTVALPDAYGFTEAIFETDPAGQPWTVSSANASEVGAKVIA